MTPIIEYGSQEKAVLNNIVSDSDYFYSGVQFLLTAKKEITYGFGCGYFKRFSRMGHMLFMVYMGQPESIFYAKNPNNAIRRKKEA
jgi:hypothetical protein